MAEALIAFSAAEELVTDTEIEISTADCLERASAGKISAYDAEFVVAAERLDLLLVTADVRLVKAFPDRAIAAEEFARGR
jgi:predicted nucleic acid-binding protein